MVKRQIVRLVRVCVEQFNNDDELAFLRLFTDQIRIWTVIWQYLEKIKDSATNMKYSRK